MNPSGMSTNTCLSASPGSNRCLYRMLGWRLVVALCSVGIGTAQALPGHPDEVATWQLPVADARPARWPMSLDEFPWPPAGRHERLLHGVRWQGCPLEAEWFHSPEAPRVLARYWAQRLPESPGLLLEPEVLMLHWYAAGRHWVLSLAATEQGGTSGSLSTLALEDCVVAEPLEHREAQSMPVGAVLLLDTDGNGAVGEVRQRWYWHDVAEASEAWSVWADWLATRGWTPVRAQGDPGGSSRSWESLTSLLQLSLVPVSQGWVMLGHEQMRRNGLHPEPVSLVRPGLADNSKLPTLAAASLWRLIHVAPQDGVRRSAQTTASESP